MSKNYLNEIRKWSKFLSILGFIFIGLMLIASVFMTAFFSNAMENQEALGGSSISSVSLGVAYVIMAILYFFPVFYLFKFSINIKSALYHDSHTTMEEAFKYLKSHFKFIGILTIVIIAVYTLIFTFGGLTLLNA